MPQAGPGDAPEEINEQLSQAGTQYLRRHLRPGATIGIGSGDTVLRHCSARVAIRSRASRLQPSPAVSTPTRVASWDRRTTIPGPTSDSCRPPPFLASSPKIAAALREETTATSVLQLAASAEATLIGIGSVLSSATILRHSVVNETQLAQYRDRGAVGDILAEWYDRDGKVVDVDFHRLRIGIPISDLQAMPNVIAVASGIDKLDAIAGALAGKYLDVLVTTEDVAEALVAAPR